MGRLRRHTNWWVNLVLLVVIAAGVAGAVVLMRGKASASTTTRTVTVALGNVSSTVSASGTVAPATSMDLNFLTSGVVSEVDVKVGDKVTAGQVVGRLDPTDADAKVASAQAALVTAQDNLAAAQTTYSNDVAAGYSSTSTQLVAAYRTLKEARASLASSQAALGSAVKARSYNDLTSPIAGTVTVVNGVVGQPGGGSTAFASVATTDQMVVTAGFSEVDVAKVKPDQAATITFPAVPTATAQAKVTTVADTSTVTSNVVTYEVTVALTSLPPGVRSGMSADVDITTQSATNVVAVPNQAITTTGRTSTVRKLVNGTEQITPVQIGVKGNSTSQVTSGVAVGDVLVLQTTTATGGTGTTGTRGGFGGGGAIGGAGIGGGGGLGR